MRGSTNAPPKPEIENFTGAPVGELAVRFQPVPAAAGAGPPDVSQLAPAEAARTLANWNYDRQNWTHAIEHYQAAIAAVRIIPMSGPISAIVFASSASRRRRSNNTRSRKRRTRCTRTVFSTRSAFLPTCCTTRSAPCGRPRLRRALPAKPSSASQDESGCSSCRRRARAITDSPRKGPGFGWPFKSGQNLDLQRRISVHPGLAAPSVPPRSRSPFRNPSPHSS